jgi:hypothetical protein
VTCRVIRLANGEAVIVCSRGYDGPRCYVCGDPQAFLCDYPVTRDGNPGTCDKRMCFRCANEVGPDRHYCNGHYRRSKAGEAKGD